MKTHFSEIELKYDGTQLQSHFAYNNFDIISDSIVAFIGPCDVKKENLVDLEDVKANKFIYSENMLHFIVEHFESNLQTTIAYQRLLIDLIIQELKESEPDISLTRRGDDIYDETLKFSVSIATKSPVSTLIHTGINISSKNTPLPTSCLENYKINPHAVATSVLNRYRAEIENMKRAAAKVKGCQ